MIGAIIPSRYQFDLLCNLLRQLEEFDVKDVLVLDNGMTSSQHDLIEKRAKIVRCFDRNIYEMWNLGWSYGVANEWDSVAILNDDIEIDEFTLPIMAASLDDYWAVSPDPDAALGSKGPFNLREVQGTYKDGGLLGFCFAIDIARYPQVPFDENFEWWWGDDDFVMQTRQKGGKIARIEGLGITHVGSASEHYRPDLQNAKERDLARFKQKWVK